MKLLNDGFVYFQSKRDLLNNGDLSESEYDFIDEIKRSCAFYFYQNNRIFVLTASYANADKSSPEYYISNLQTHQRKQVFDLQSAKDEMIRLVCRTNLN